MNTQINVNVQGEIRFPDLALLAQAIAGKAVAPAPAQEATVAATIPVPIAHAPAPVPVPPSTPTAAAIPTSVPASVPTPAPAPVAPAAPTSAVPTSVPKYSIDDIARAGAQLAAQGPDKLAALNGLLQQFGLQSLTQLPPEQMPAFVQSMRGLGARI